MIITFNIWDWLINAILISVLVLFILAILQILQEIIDNWKFDKMIRERNQGLNKMENK